MQMIDRLLSKCEKSTESKCWLWKGAKHKFGYGLVRVNGKHKKAHRLSYEQFKGPIPDGALICHTCDTPGCINPDHLYAGTTADNMRDRKLRGRYGQTADLSGEKNGNAQLSARQVREIKNAEGYQKDIAKRFGVNQSTVCRIKSGKRWGRAALKS